jgi:hypothetical protein
VKIFFELWTIGHSPSREPPSLKLRRGRGTPKVFASSRWDEWTRIDTNAEEMSSKVERVVLNALANQSGFAA